MYYGEEYIEINPPLYYRGFPTNSIYLTGIPFRVGVDSLFKELRNEIKFDLIENGDPEISLDTYAVQDLKTEAYAYSARASLESRRNMQQRVISNYDDFRRIMQIISKHAYEPKEREKAEKELELSKVHLNGFMAAYAANLRNYSWAEKLLNDGLDLLSSNSLGTSRFHEVYGEYPVCIHLMGNAYLDLRNCLEITSRKIESKKMSDKEPPDNLLPDTAPHPLSLGAQLKDAVDEQRFMDAAKIRDKIRKVQSDLSSSVNFVRWAGRELIVDYLPEDVGYKLSSLPVLYLARNLHILGNKGNRAEELIHLSDSGSQENPRISMKNKKHHPTIFGLANSDPYVLRFDRFGAHIIVEGKETQTTTNNYGPIRLAF